jgi:hypothetical protein
LEAAKQHKIVAFVRSAAELQLLLANPGARSAELRAGTPEAVGAHNYKVNYLPLVSWTWTVNSKLLVEAGGSANVFDNNTQRTDPSVGLDTIAITELSTNFRYGSRALSLTHAGGYRIQHNRQYRQRASVSYVTGSHSLKTGVDLSEYSEGRTRPGERLEPDQRWPVVHVQESHPGASHHLGGAVRGALAFARHRRLRSGSVDDSAADAQPRRPLQQLQRTRA